MSREKITWLLDAQDKATAKIQNVTENVERQVKQVKDMGGKAKASTELVGTMATAMGGAGVGGFAGEIAQLTERVSAFSEVAKGGGLAATAFKVGLAGAVAVIATKVGSAIGNAIFLTEKWKNELEGTEKAAARLADKLVTGVADRLNAQKSKIELMDPDAQGAAFAKMGQQVDGELKNLSRTLEQRKKRLIRLEEDSFKLLPNTESFNLQIENAKRDIEATEKKLEITRSINQELIQRDSLAAKQERRLALEGKSREFVDQLKQQNSLLGESARRVELLAAIKATVNGKDRMEAIRLVNEKHDFIEAEKAKAVAIKKTADAARDRAAKERKANAERVAAFKQQVAEQARVENLRKSTGDSIRLEILRLKEGEQAARSMALQMQGLNKNAADRAAFFEAQLDKIRDTASGPKPDLQAKESRLLTGRSQANKQVEAAKQQVELAKKQQELLGKIDKVLGKIQTNTAKPVVNVITGAQ